MNDELFDFLMEWLTAHADCGPASNDESTIVFGDHEDFNVKELANAIRARFES